MDKKDDGKVGTDNTTLNELMREYIGKVCNHEIAISSDHERRYLCLNCRVADLHPDDYRGMPNCDLYVSMPSGGSRKFGVYQKRK